MVMVIGPTKKKAEAKAEQRRKREGGRCEGPGLVLGTHDCVTRHRATAARYQPRQHQPRQRASRGSARSHRHGQQDRGRDHYC